MKNPFKFGTVVEEEFFTDRQEELQYICRVMDSENHLALISPRRFGKSSLVLKAVKQLKRPYIMLNMQSITSTKDLSNRILESVLKLYEQSESTTTQFQDCTHHQHQPDERQH